MTHRRAIKEETIDHDFLQSGMQTSRRFKMNHRDILAYARGVPNVFEKEIPRLVRMSGASAILSCERRIQYTSCYLCLIFP